MKKPDVLFVSKEHAHFCGFHSKEEAVTKFVEFIKDGYDFQHSVVLL